MSRLPKIRKDINLFDILLSSNSVIPGSMQWINCRGTTSTISLLFRFESNSVCHRNTISLHHIKFMKRRHIIPIWCSGARSLHGVCDRHSPRRLSFNQGRQQPGRERGNTNLTCSINIFILLLFQKIVSVGSRDGLVGCSAPTYVCRNGMLQVILLDT